MTESAAQIILSARSTGLTGSVRVPGDKSVSHRALMFGGLAIGETRITGLLEGEDVMNTAKAMRALGASVEREVDADGGTTWVVRGRGVGGLLEPGEVLDMGNSGTGARLLCGVLASHPITAVMTGDASLRSRPMDRVVAPLGLMGARFESRDGNRLPLTVIGTGDPVPMVYESPVASAQIKSAVLLAGLQAKGATTVIEPAATRDHTERMLRHFGADVRSETVADQPGAVAVTVVGQPELEGSNIVVPGDPSSAAFLIVAALITADSEVSLLNVGLNPHRTGLFETLKDMGADLAIANERVEGGEPVGDLVARSSKLRGVVVPAARAPSMIDEYPVLAMAAACAEGETRMEGLGELRVKESDRLSAIADGLNSCDVMCEIDGDTLIVSGCAGAVPGDAVAQVHLDHRIAMSFLVLGLASEQPIGIDDDEAIATSYPSFLADMTTLGANFKKVADPKRTSG
ncbi:MAG: 3-phosphoshikimate 1-carboxyvinyltransferase [Alphaproteobacteria bacterium]|nr:3-phosphoshikimate 1-carboxyvinyltransferase [Alphaproteobacteria bacterium]